MNLEKHFDTQNQTHKAGNADEHTSRGELLTLIYDLVSTFLSSSYNPKFSYSEPDLIYPEFNALKNKNHKTKGIQYLNSEIINAFAQKLGLTFVPEKEPEGNVCFINSPEVRDDFKTTFAPIDLLDFFYAVSHSANNSGKYKEFIKIDFPGVPFPKSTAAFWQLVKLGGEIRQIHLPKSQVLKNFITQFPVDGDDVVIKPNFQSGNVYINDTQYFSNVPETIWNLNIGGYQPAQKWLNDREDKKLNREDILHYQKIMVALTETGKLIKGIDKIDIEANK